MKRTGHLARRNLEHLYVCIRRNQGGIIFRRSASQVNIVQGREGLLTDVLLLLLLFPGTKANNCYIVVIRTIMTVIISGFARSL
jgi:hypothetical protein